MGSLDSGAALTSELIDWDADWDESIITEYLSDDDTVALAKAIYNYKLKHPNDAKWDNYNLDEFKRCIEYYDNSYVKESAEPVEPNTEIRYGVRDGNEGYIDDFGSEEDAIAFAKSRGNGAYVTRDYITDTGDDFLMDSEIIWESKKLKEMSNMTYKDWNIEEMTGYTPKTTFYMDFSIADKFGASAVKDTYNRAFDSWKDNVEYLTELVMVLNWKIWEHYETNLPLAELQQDLYYKTDDWAMSNLKDEDLQYFLRTTD